MARIQPEPPENRDPKGINRHLKISFKDVLGEINHLQSLDMVWDFTTMCYHSCRLFTYGLSTLFCAPCIAITWGCKFACLTMAHVWCLTPVYLNLRFCVKDVLESCFRTICDCCISPLTEPCSKIFRWCPKRKPESQPQLVPEPVEVKVEPAKKKKAAVVDGYVVGTEQNMRISIVRQMKLYS